jgi:hypothetical protein
MARATKIFISMAMITRRRRLQTLLQLESLPIPRRGEKTPAISAVAEPPAGSSFCKRRKKPPDFVLQRNPFVCVGRSDAADQFVL